MNPAVSLGLAAVGKFPVRSLLHYLPAQYLGAWLGSALVLLTYRDAIIHFYADMESQDWDMNTAGIFITSPAAGVSNLGGAIDQVRALSRDVTCCHDVNTMNDVTKSLLRLWARPSSSSVSVQSEVPRILKCPQ